MSEEAKIAEKIHSISVSLSSLTEKSASKPHQEAKSNIPVENLSKVKPSDMIQEKQPKSIIGNLTEVSN